MAGLLNAFLPQVAERKYGMYIVEKARIKTH